MTIPASGAAQLDLAEVRAAFEACVRETCPDELPMARRLVERLPPARWTLEWYLPWWLGAALGLDPSVSREVVLSNVLGLGSVRLQDDLADGEVAREEVDGARRLATSLYRAALRPYEAWFEPASPFWTHLRRCMDAWQAASTDVGDAGADHRLAARGAPLKISAFAVCELADRATVYEALEPCLDHALDALVRYDHVADWEADLAAGRWNRFVADVSSGRQDPEARRRHHRAVLAAMLASGALASQFDQIRQDLLAAAASADKLGPGQGVAVPELVEHLRRLAADVEAQGASFGAHYRDLGDRAAELLLHRRPDARS